MIRYASSEDTQGRVPNLGYGLFLKTQIGTTFKRTGNFSERRRLSEPLKALKRHFQHSRADSCVKKVPKIDCYFLLIKL